MSSLQHGFKLIRTENLADCNGKAYFYEHQIHHCPFIHIETSTQNNYFSISFKTTCNDDTGATHVLEHMVLHGSAKYPISDVFQELYKRSLANNLNAATALDYTSYYFSTQNKKDFHNILDVYLDAVFNPNLNEDNFLIECHRLEPTDFNDSSSPLKHTGVVYSEMCGVFSDSSTYFDEKTRMAMMPDTPYKYVFGGDPDAIANLTLDQLKVYHSLFYSPSNCYMFHFGSFSIDPILERIDSFLSKIEPSRPQNFDFNLIQPKFDKPHVITVDGPVDPMLEISEQYKACLSWHLCNIQDVDLIKAFEIIATLLTESAATLLFQRLIKTQIGGDFTTNGVDDTTPNVTFSIGLDHIEEENIEKFKTIVFDTLQEIVANGFSDIEIHSVLHLNELDIKRPTSDPGERLHDIFVEYWINGIDPLVIFRESERIEKLKQMIESQPRYLESLIQKYLLDNQSYIFLVMKPVAGFTESLNEKRNSSINENISPDLRESITNKSKAVHELVNKKKPVELLPEIHIDDIDPIASKIEFKKENNIELFPMFTNDLIYLTIKADLPLNNKELLPDAVLLAIVYGVIGCGDLDDQEFSNQENLYTGGISISAKPSVDKNDPDKITGSFYIKTHFLKRNMQNAINLVKTLLFEPFLDNKEQIYATFNTIESDSASMIQEEGNKYSRIKGASQFSRYYTLTELWSGLTFIDRLREVKESEECLTIIKDVYEQLFLKAHFQCSIVADEQNIIQVKNLMRPIIDKLNENTDFNGINDYSFIDSVRESSQSDKIFYEFETMTNTTTSLCKTVPYFSDLSVPIGILSSLLETEFIYTEVREKIGAYGVSCSHLAFLAVISISSYRDKDCINCLKAYKSSIEKVARGEFDNGNVERSIINYFSIIDQPCTPNNRAKRHSFNSVTYEDIQSRRTKALKTTKKELIEAAKFLLNQKWFSYVFGNRTASDMPEGFTVQELE